ncbi:MAG: uncharacterized protein V7631_3749 [Massilia sp.]|jgi:hypothetical protein
MKLEQRAMRFQSGGVGLIGIVDVPERPLVRGMLVVPDRTQYRAGSHRQFTLLSRLLAARGVAVMRFDRRGAGDSEGDAGSGLAEEMGAEDIAAAMKEFFIHVPEMKESVILAPGDAAPLAARYAAGDPRVSGLALLEPLLPPELAPARGVRQDGPRSAAERLFRRASAFRRAAARAGLGKGPVPPARPAPAVTIGAFGGRLLLVTAGVAPARAAACPAEPQPPRSRRIEIAGGGPDERGGAWRDAVAFACASWLTSW